MEPDQESQRSKEEPRGRGRRFLMLFLAVLLAGGAAGVAANFLFAGSDSGGPKEKARQGESSAPLKDREEKEKYKVEFTVSQAMSHIYAMSSQFPDRTAGSVHESSAANYIVSKLGEYGYTVEDQPFTLSEGYASRNIIGTRRGTREGFTLLVGAHYDSDADSPGANDNGSGVGVVLELARVFAERRLEASLKFVFFGANRPGWSDPDERLVGSRRFVEMLGTFEKKEIVGMLAVDCVGQGEVTALRTRGTGLQRLKAKLETYAREKGINVAYMKSDQDSDNIPFEDSEMPAVWVEWCESDGALVTDNTYNSVIAGRIEATGVLLEGFLLDLTPDDLEELKY